MSVRDGVKRLYPWFADRYGWTAAQVRALSPADVDVYLTHWAQTSVVAKR